MTTYTTDITIRIEHANGSTSTFNAVGSEESYTFDKTDLVSLEALRSDVNTADPAEDDDEVYLDVVTADGTTETVFGGILRDIDRHGPTATLTAGSFEELARDGEPTSGDERWDGASDDEIINDAIGDVDELTAGTVANIEDDLTFVFSHTSQAKKIRTVTDATAGFVRYNSDKTVDYIHIDDFGADKTDVTISPSSENMIERFDVTRNGGDERKTHLRMLGAGEGEAQVSTTVVADDYSSGERKKWGTRVNKDLTDESTLEKHGKRLIEQLNEGHIEVETVIVNEDVELGDEYHLEYADEGVDHDLEVVEVTRVIDAEGVRYETVFSNRNEARETEYEREIKDIDRYNKAFEGTSVTLSTDGGRQPVDDGHNYEMAFWYPDDVVHEHRVKLHVAGRAYRSYHEGAAASPAVSQTSGDNAVFENVVAERVEETNKTLDDDQWYPVDDFGDIDAETSVGLVTLNTRNIGSGSTKGWLHYRVRTLIDGEYNYHPSSDGVSVHTDSDADHDATTIPVVVAEDVDGGDIQPQVRYEPTTGDTDSQFYLRQWYQFAGKHTHDVELPEHDHEPEPGIIESFDGTRHYPENCDVLVNGSSLGESIGDGDGSFEETVDLRGHLNEGEYNTIEVTSDSLGHVQATVDVDAYRQIRED